MCSGVVGLEGVGDVHVCVFVCFHNACCDMFVMERGSTRLKAVVQLAAGDGEL